MPESETTRGSILVVDDDADIRALVEAVLVDAGYSVETMESGKNAVQSLKSAAPDLVILDVIMPEQDGIETVREIRRQHRDLPVVVMSGSGPASTYLRVASALGATATLPKPFSPDELLATVEGLIFGRARR